MFLLFDWFFFFYYLSIVLCSISIPINSIPTQCLRNFLCASANLPPPRLEIHWASNQAGHCPSLDDMQMDELFGRHPDDQDVR